jgi:hypothetical protein
MDRTAAHVSDMAGFVRELRGLTSVLSLEAALQAWLQRQEGA